jgi:chromatin segregation and condensation protein Rec8/ScpA/Scc1 (kleisin family)
MEEVTGRLEREGRLPLSALFTPPWTRPRLVGYFLAILELTRRFTIRAEQEEQFGDIWVSLIPPAAPGGAEQPAGA